MKYYTFLKLTKISILFLSIISVLGVKVAQSNDSFEENIFKFKLVEDNNVLMSYIGEDKILKQSI